MQSLEQLLSNLGQFKIQQHIILQVVKQLEKDFIEFELNLGEIPEQEPYEALLKEMMEIIDSLFERQPERLFALLYRIDIAEEKVKAGLLSERPAYSIADLILNRELQKVIVRNFYAA